VGVGIFLAVLQCAYCKVRVAKYAPFGVILLTIRSDEEEK